MSVTLFILDNVYVSEKTFKFVASKMKQRQAYMAQQWYQAADTPMVT
jgi:hypothetical protein